MGKSGKKCTSETLYGGLRIRSVVSSMLVILIQGMMEKLIVVEAHMEKEVKQV